MAMSIRCAMLLRILPCLLLVIDVDAMKVTSLYRYPVKGLGADAPEKVELKEAGCFPDDRRYALLRRDREWKGEWLHKENFLCAFSNPELLAQYETHYSLRSSDPQVSRAYPSDALIADATTTQRMLQVRKSGEELLQCDLATAQGRDALAQLLSRESGQDVVCVGDRTEFQFGNTSSGVKHRGDTRTVHLVNAETVRNVQTKLGLARLRPERFRPNVVLDGVPAWQEFDWIGQTLVTPSGMRLKVVNRTVRCQGVSVDPKDPNVLDIPKLLAEHFPEHGPYLGIYAVVEEPGSLAVNDVLELE